MKEFNVELLKKLYFPSPGSHKGQNGKLMLIGGSHLFHAASLWALTVASRIVDMVFYSSVPENNEIIQRARQEFCEGIVVPRDRIEDYISEADCVLIGPGMVRTEKSKIKNQISPLRSKSFEGQAKIQLKNKKLEEINRLEDEGEQAYWLTKYLLEKYPYKKWVIDAGALQMMEPEWLLQLNGNVVITPHPKEFERLKFKVQNSKFKVEIQNEKLEEQAALFAKEFNCIVLLKGSEDVVCSLTECISVFGGNAGMTKGGTGDVLAGLVASLACKNDLFLSASSASYLNKKAGERLYKKMGYYFNASDLAAEIPLAMNDLIIKE